MPRRLATAKAPPSTRDSSRRLLLTELWKTASNHKTKTLQRRFLVGLILVVLVLFQAVYFWTPYRSSSQGDFDLAESKDVASPPPPAVPSPSTSDVKVTAAATEKTTDDSLSGTPARVQETWGSYSKFLGSCPLNDAQALHFVVLSDRADDSRVPLLAMVNSLLVHSRSPIVLHVVTSNDIDWLLELDKPHLQINFYRPQSLMESSLHLMKTSNFSTSHYSGPFAMQKLFLADLPYPPSVRKVLMLDDDYIFLSDPTALVTDILLADVYKVNLHCPTDSWRIGFHSGTHYPGRSRYCISGIMGLPIQKTTTELFVNATFLVMKDYPNFKSKFADQDVVNRVLYAYPDRYSLIPCYWSCDINSCKEGFEKKKCKNCDLAQHGETCKAVHFLNKEYKNKRTFEREEYSWDYYFNADMKKLALDFADRVAGKLPCR